LLPRRNKFYSIINNNIQNFIKNEIVADASEEPLEEPQKKNLNALIKIYHAMP